VIASSKTELKSAYLLIQPEAIGTLALKPVIVHILSIKSSPYFDKI
jgi:hypothetical protein